MHKIYNNIKHMICFSCLLAFSATVFPEGVDKEICFNFTIVTQKTGSTPEKERYKKQKKRVLEELIRTQSVFDSNIERSCPKLNFNKGTINHVDWEKARQLNNPLDQLPTETDSEYKTRKTKENANEIKSIAKRLKDDLDIKYYQFLALSPGQAIVYANRVLQQTENKPDIVLGLQDAIDEVTAKLNSDGVEADGVVISRAETMITKYETIDRVSADSWNKGILTLWNDVEAQDTSIEVKNLLAHHQSTENKCIDVFVVPKAKSPSRSKIEIQNKGDWTSRGGAALSEKLFPRTTDGRGHAIILTQDGRETENRLAHELGHLLIDMPDAHIGKEAKDLMHENSLGGTYLDEEECKKIQENITSFSLSMLSRQDPTWM